MALVDAYNTKTGDKLPYLVPEAHIDHPVLGADLSRLPSSGASTVASLKAEIAQRNTGRAVEDQIPATGNKAALVAALAADDAAGPPDPVNPTETPASGDRNEGESHAENNL